MSRKLLGCLSGSSAIVSVAGSYDSYVWIAEGWVVGNGPTAQLPAGHYQLMVTDDNGCIGTQNFHLPEFEDPDVSISVGAYLGLEGAEGGNCGVVFEG